MIQNPYFSQLRHEFQNDPYRDRFLAELEDHAEDLAESENRSSKSLNLNFMHKHFGDPKQVKKDFNAIIDPWANLFFVLEGLFYGLLSLSFSLIGTRLIQGFVSDLTPNPFVFSVFIAWFFIYLFAWRRYLKLKEKSSHSFLLWLVFVLSPSVVYGALFFSGILNAYIPLYLEFSNLNLAQSIWCLTLFLVGHGASAFLAWKLQNKEEKKGVFRPPVKFAKQFKVFIFAYITTFILFRTLGSYFGFPYFDNLGLDWVKNIFAPLIVAEYMFFFILSATFDNSIFGFYLSVFLMVFLAVACILIVAKHKNFFSGQALVVLYVASFLFMSPNTFILHPDYQVPHLSISQVVEKEEFGILYPYLKYLSSNQSIPFRYNIGLVSHSSEYYFSIQKSTGKTFFIHLATLDENEMDLKNLIIKNINNVQREQSSTTHSLVCEKMIDDFADYGATGPTEKVILNKGDDLYFNHCQKLFMGEHLLVDSPLSIRDWVFSEDGDWLLLHLQKGTDGQDEVHLLNLRDLQS